MKRREFLAVIPVFTVGSAPVRFGPISSLSPPNGNATGIMLFSSTLSAKRPEPLTEVVPGAAVVALLMKPANPNLGLSIPQATLLRAGEVFQ